MEKKTYIDAKTGKFSELLDAGALRKSLKLPAQEPEPLAHAPPRELELIAESA